MPWRDTNADQDGNVHEGAVLALLDTTGAMASWAETGHGRYKASTPAIQAQILAPAGQGELVAYGRCVLRDRELLWSDVDVVRRDDCAHLRARHRDLPDSDLGSRRGEAAPPHFARLRLAARCACSRRSAGRRARARPRAPSGTPRLARKRA